MSLDSSLLRVQPWQNPWLIPGVLIPYALHLLVVYFTPLSKVFGLSPLTRNEWKVRDDFLFCFLLRDIFFLMFVVCNGSEFI